MALQTIGDLFFLICYIPGFYTYKGFITHLHMNSLNIIVDFSNLHIFQGTKDLARYVTFSRCIRVRGHPSLEDVTFTWTSHSP
ncbi:hypothetical protein HanPI659440_Chr08g0308551 [Helianthus annuus]|nr:hypothetical protein HanPI659440_Chr08g0308551 [Helianthus annuus]